MTTEHNSYHTKIWHEIPSDNQFYADDVFCHGYNIFEDLIHNASYTEYLYTLFSGQKPNDCQRALLELLLIAIAHPGIRDLSVRAAMNAGVGGSRAAAGLMAALAVGAGQYTGAQEVRLAIDIMRNIKEAAPTTEDFSSYLQIATNENETDVWLDQEHVPGFDIHVASIRKPALALLTKAASLSDQASHCGLLLEKREILENSVGYGVGMTGVCACIFADLNLSPEIAEYIYLFARLPGAAVQALEARNNGFRAFPFYTDAVQLHNDPGPHTKALPRELINECE